MPPHAGSSQRHYPSALYLGQPGAVDRELDWIVRLLPDFDADANRLLLFAQSGASGGWPLSAGDAGSAYCALPQECFGRVIVGTTCRLFRNPWSQAMLSHLYAAVRPGGSLVVPFVSEAEAQRKGYWSRTALEQFFGHGGREPGDQGVLVLTREGAPPVVDSTLRWHFGHRGSLPAAHAELRSRAGGIELAGVRALLGPMLLSEEPIAIDELTLADVLESEGLESVLAVEDYLIGGVGYKSALLNHIARRYLPPDRPLRFLDQGGGAGFLAAELALQPDLTVQRSVCVDASLAMALTARRMHDGLRRALADRFAFSLTRAGNFTYADQYDLISFISALMYMPRDEARDAASRAFEALRPGGVLIVHENIKSPSYKRDYDLMFTVEELEALLSPFGTPEYYLSTATIEIPREQVGQRSVFRVIQKQ
ncbi:MAG: class I SAM-dependent methyltransferase [Phycisphaerales bacterium]|nr:MAG: class I SAM-dependent methyltransferase [Phycisphaerales bacterium]